MNRNCYDGSWRDSEVESFVNCQYLNHTLKNSGILLIVLAAAAKGITCHLDKSTCKMMKNDNTIHVGERHSFTSYTFLLCDLQNQRKFSWRKKQKLFRNGMNLGHQSNQYVEKYEETQHRLN